MYFFSFIGVLVTLKWMWASAFAYNDVVLHQPLKTTLLQTPVPTIPASAHEKCPWSHVFSDLTSRLQLLEAAFKEQAAARELIELEINNQSDLNNLLNTQLSVFLNRIEKIGVDCVKLEKRFNELSTRLHGDETLVSIMCALCVGLILLTQLYPRCRDFTAMLNFSPRRKVIRQELPADRKDSLKNNSAPPTPKHGKVMRNELCIILFRKENNNIYTSLVETLLKHVDDAKVAVKPYFTVEQQEDLKHLPFVKLFIVIIDVESCLSSHKRNEEKELYVNTLKTVKSLGAASVVIIANDEASKKLTSHNVYNTSLNIIQTQDIAQELASNGRLFSMWRELTSHQMSHLRKIIKTVLNIKQNIRQ